MAGHCGCNEPHTPPVLEKGADAKTEEAWLWLSRQVATILAAPGSIPRGHVAANLLAALRQGGFVSKWKMALDSDAFAEALLDRFSDSLLKDLGFGMVSGLPRLGSALAITPGVIEGKSIPSVLRLLLLARLVTDDVASLWNPAQPEPTPSRECLPSRYSLRTKTYKGRTRIDKDAIASALSTAKGNIFAAAKFFGVGFKVLAVDLKYHRIRVPLTEITSNRLGLSRIAAVREALVLGVPKGRIQKIYDVSEWSILLIELDQPELEDAHGEASKLSQREKYRNALLALLRDSQAGPRIGFVKRYCYEWLSKYDATWLDVHLPKSRTKRRKGKSKPRKDFYQIDLAAAMAVRQAASQERAKPDQPIWLSRTHLLSSAGVRDPLNPVKQKLFPNAMAEAESLAETREQFTRRTIRWALHVYAGHQQPISIRRLRKVAHLAPETLVEYRLFIIEVAAELELTFDAHCCLAPWNGGSSERHSSADE